jgi:hypothetical protein
MVRRARPRLAFFCAVYRKRMPCKGAIPVEKEQDDYAAQEGVK